jgi:hypothetical protein
MWPARHAAVRCGCLVAILAIAPRAGAADDATLFLPLGDTVSLSAPPAEEPSRRGRLRSLPFSFRSLPTRAQILPDRVDMPDHYSQEWDITLRPWVAPVDADRVVGLDLLPAPYRPWTATLAYDEEDRGRMPGDADVLRIVIERKF